MKFLIILILVLLLLRWLLKPLFVFIVRRTVAQVINNQQGTYQNKTSKKRKEGNIDIDYIPENYRDGKGNRNTGEYIDYEEIK